MYFGCQESDLTHKQEMEMNSIIYLVGLVVVILFILSFLGLR
jgi:hypothetical protein